MNQYCHDKYAPILIAKNKNDKICKNYWNLGWLTEDDYSVGATECQDERPWEYDNEVECVQVERKIVQVEQWVEIK